MKLFGDNSIALLNKKASNTMRIGEKSLFVLSTAFLILNPIPSLILYVLSTYYVYNIISQNTSILVF